MSLFDKLKEMREAQNGSGQCACGAHLQGECPDCSGDEVPGAELVERLQAIGDKKEVNPPKPDWNMPCSVCGVGFPPGTLEEHEERCRDRASRTASEPEKTESDPEPSKSKKSPASGTCPTCGKEFLHLSRHRCKKAEASEPPKEEKKEEGEAEVEPVPPESVDEAKKEEAEMKRGVGLGGRDGHIHDEPAVPAYDLIIDAVFLNNEDCDAMLFTDIIGPICEAVAKENQVDFWSVVDYGKGPGLIAAKLERWIQQTKPEGVILASSSTPEFWPCREILIRYARNVLLGVR